ncbi:MAG TPA: 50S ribosomal protein L35 [Nitrospinae bacterium]|nr:50S ribosomal protein L35 [Nitrospinota bacterium]HBA26967.1 50S ribosomal protein L35 [Nitrospinota bacterium]
MLKTNKAAAKRFKLTGKGKLKKKNAFTRHLLTRKSQGRKRKLRKSGVLNKTDTKRVRKLIPYI